MSEILPPDPIDLGDGRVVLFDEPTVGFYRVRMPSGEIQAFAAKGVATPEDAVDDIVTNPPAAAAPVLSQSVRVILSRLNPVELAAIWNSVDPLVIRFRSMALAVGHVESNDPDAQAGFAYLVAQGYLTANRPAELLAP